ncbi:hypothetical protein LMG28138_01996 [Pararobbsia alpina]|uniref:Uncharacterized protein n=1 Tax=Pararobbsia alpina TaxID=621374 RepID=A0A6S7B236_9BURK|nr:hypothetical protein LMG28138_01996 [Pararobbsia alpina]
MSRVPPALLTSVAVSADESPKNAVRPPELLLIWAVPALELSLNVVKPPSWLEMLA